MGIWTQVRAVVETPHRQFVAALCDRYHEALRRGNALRRHAEQSPYPQHAAILLALAERAEKQARTLTEELRLLGSAPDHPPPPRRRRGGRNHWERLAADLLDAQEASNRYLELAHHWDGDFPERAATLMALAQEIRLTERSLGELVTRSDPHAAD